MKGPRRKPTDAERQILVNLHNQSLAEFMADAKSAQDFVRVGEATGEADLKPAELAAMSIVARAILNLHETITRS